MLQAEYRVGVRHVCEVLQFNRSTYYYQTHRDEQRVLRMKIRDYAATYVRYGYLRIHALLLREGYRINK